jgi:hypothetical protein
MCSHTVEGEEEVTGAGACPRDVLAWVVLVAGVSRHDHLQPAKA